MAVLSDAERKAVADQFMRDNAEAIGAVVKADILAAVGGLDDYLNTNATAINTAIPQPARGVLTTTHKARLFGFVVRKRYL